MRPAVKTNRSAAAAAATALYVIRERCLLSELPIDRRPGVLLESLMHQPIPPASQSATVVAIYLSVDSFATERYFIV